MPATVVAERIGWARGMTILKERVAEVRPLFLEPDPLQRTDYRPGELAQWDIWLPGVDIPVGYGHSARLPVIVGVAGYSRVIVGRMIPSREAPDVLLGNYAASSTSAPSPEKASTTTRRRSAESSATGPYSPPSSWPSRARSEWGR
jgi:hypothetical protein